VGVLLYFYWTCGASATLYPKSDEVLNNKIIKAITDVSMSLYCINSEVCLLNY